MEILAFARSLKTRPLHYVTYQNEGSGIIGLPCSAVGNDCIALMATLAYGVTVYQSQFIFKKKELVLQHISLILVSDSWHL